MSSRILTAKNAATLPPRFTSWHTSAFPNRLTPKELSDALTLYFSMECLDETRRELSSLIEREILNGNAPTGLRNELREFVWSEGSRLADTMTARALLGFETIH